MEWISIDELFNFQLKSKLKARDGQETGKYIMYSSSSKIDKFVDDYIFENEALIIGTGGNANIHYSMGEFSTTADCYVLETKTENILTRYVYKFLSGNIHILEEGFRGAGLKHINQRYIKQIKVPVPPINIQKQIVEVLDEAQSLIDKRKEQIKLSDDLIESVFYDMFGDPVSNDKGWEIKKLDKVCNMKSGGTPTRKEKKYFKGDIPWITTTALGKVFVGAEDAAEYITEEAIKNSATKLIPPKSLMVGTRVGVGKVSINEVVMCTSQDVVSLLNLENNFNMQFIYKLLKTFSRYFLSQVRGATIKGINMKILKDINVIIPSLQIQNQFAQKVQQIESQKQLLEDSLKLLEDNYNSLMQRAFKGQLF